MALTVLVVLLTLVPPTAARLLGPADRVHVGTYWYHEDFPVYLAAMRSVLPRTSTTHFAVSAPQQVPHAVADTGEPPPEPPAGSGPGG